MIPARKDYNSRQSLCQRGAAGLVPGDESSKFTAKIEMVGGKPVVTWEPDGDALRATRTYTIHGKKTFLDRDWTPITDTNKNRHNFSRSRSR
ncbi:MAG: hypothetical protein ACI4Q3_03525 [Kiritimatiellia bacterium]